MRVYDHLNYNREIESVVSQHLRMMNHSFVQMSRMTLHPNDDYLYVVIAKNLYPRDVTKSYTCILYNSSINGLVEGVYNLNYLEALSVLLRKSR